MLKVKTILMSMALFLLVAVLLTGCLSFSSSSKNENDISGRKTVIKFMYIWPSGSQHILVNNIISDYEKQHPNVKIETEILETDQYRAKLKVLAASNELPDVGMTWSDGFLKPYTQANLFTPLDHVINANFNKVFVPNVKKSYDYHGKTYGLPMEFNISYVFYNEDIFKKYNLQVPKTFTDLKYIIRVLKSHGIIPVTVGAKDGWPASFWFMYLVDRIGGPNILTDVIHGKVKMTDPAIVKAAQETQNLVDMGTFEPGESALSNDEARNYFLNEKAAMFLTATWELPNYVTSPYFTSEFKDKVGYFKFPLYEGGKGTNVNSYVGGPGVGLFVAQNSGVKKQAKDFAAFLVKEWGEKSITNAGIIPATKVDTSKVELSPMYVDVLNDIKIASNVTTYFDIQASPGVSDLYHQLMTALFEKQITPEAFTKQLANALAKEQHHIGRSF
ncbi:raffinose/stachyose/melibiose transport system substrate-binding protein [Neobacillus cucumis]|nr:raffinose/stachyose/melibiose transport system substrate-binding protein [Neobacillus cucumis]